jgi:rhodanese-related sulfurtransferase
MAVHAIRIMSQDDYRRLLADDAVAIDLRRPLDYLDGHLDGAYSLPGVRLVLRHQLAALGVDRPLVLVAHNAVDLEAMIQEAQAVGGVVAGVLTGTPKGWRARGLPVVGWRPLSPDLLPRSADAPLVIDISEMPEPMPPGWPGARRLPLSAWTADTAAELAAVPVVLVGPVERCAVAAVALFENGAHTVYRGQGTISSTVA